MAGDEYIARQKNVAQRVISRFLFFIGLGLSVAAVFLVSDTRSFVERAVLVHGKVVAIERVPIPNKALTGFYPIVTYTAERGQRTIRTSTMISWFSG